MRELVDRVHPQLSVTRQCSLLGLARSTAYYEPACESEENLWLMRRIDEQYLRTPFYGSRRMAVWLQSTGQCVNRKRVRRLMQVMGIEALYPKRRTTVRGEGTAIAPNRLVQLLRERDGSQASRVVRLARSGAGMEVHSCRVPVGCVWLLSVSTLPS